MYIDEFKIEDEAYRTCGNTDVGAEAIRALLSHDDITNNFGGWTVAAYIGDACSASEPGRGEENVFDARNHTDEQRLVATAKDCRQFLRAGFEELKYEDGGWLYITADMLGRKPEMMTHAEAVAVPMRLQEQEQKKDSAAGAAGAGALSAKEEELINLVKGGKTQDWCGKANKIMQEGANPANLPVLQIAAANGDVELLEPLITRGANINFQDAKQRGVTPLMIAAQGSLRKVNKDNRKADATVVKKLLELGADKSVVDSDGRSCLGHYYSALRSLNDFSAALLGGVDMIKVDKSMVELLTPEGGATEADKDCVDDH